MLKKVIIWTFLTLWPLTGFSWTERQKEVFQTINDVCEDEGIPLNQTLKAMALVESAAGVITDSGEEGSIGIMQIKPTTAKWISGKFDALPKYESLLDYKTRLYDDRYNILVALHLMNYFLVELELTWSQSLVAYNVGLAGSYSIEDPNSFPYVQKVRKAFAEV